MKFYHPPVLNVVILNFNTFKTQTGNPSDGSSTIVPSNPDNDCPSFDCEDQVGGGALFEFVVTWNDNAGSDINGYTVVVDARGALNLTNATSGCEISGSPSGTYALKCSDLVVPVGDCCNPNPFQVTLLSIRDGDDNTLAVSNESCADSAACN